MPKRKMSLNTHLRTRAVHEILTTPLFGESLTIPNANHLNFRMAIGSYYVRLGTNVDPKSVDAIKKAVEYIATDTFGSHQTSALVLAGLSEFERADAQLLGAVKVITGIRPVDLFDLLGSHCLFAKEQQYPELAKLAIASNFPIKDFTM